MLDSVPGTLMLTDCLEQCQSNDSCSSVNYETGLCILFSSNADKLPGKRYRHGIPISSIPMLKSSSARIFQHLSTAQSKHLIYLLIEGCCKPSRRLMGVYHDDVKSEIGFAEDGKTRYSLDRHSRGNLSMHA